MTPTLIPEMKRLATTLAVAWLAATAACSGEAYLDNQTQYSNQDPHTETRRSDHFRINFGHYNRDTGTPMTEQLAQGNLQMFEQAWNRWVVEMGMHDINESATNPDGNKYRANFNVLMTWNDGGGGGAYSSMDAGGFGYAMANTGYCRFDPPSGATPHEFGHAWQITAGGFNGTDSSGSWWEGHANWMQLQFLNTYPQAGGYISNGMYYPSHGRAYYDSFMIWEAAREDARYGAKWVNEVWTNATPAQQQGEYVIDRMIRLDSSGSPDKAGAMKDLWGDMAKKLVTWDFERQQWLATANKPDDGSDWEFYQRCRTPLVKVAGSADWYRPGRGHLPMEFGFNIIPLQATAGTTVSCNFAPHCDPVRQSDWRACLVAVNAAGGASYSTLWNSGTNSIPLSADQTKLYLVVIATPKPMKIAEPAWQAYLTDAGLQFPYAVSFTNAAPKNVIYPAQSRGGMVQHGNGGGWKSTSATVDDSAYVGPNAQVLNSAQVKGMARIEDFAVVRNNAQVRDNAVVSGHAEVKDNAQVYGNAKVRDWGRVFGHAEIYGNAKVIEHGNCGDGNAATHTKVYGNAIVKGTTYVYNTSTLNGGLIMDGDSANGNGTTPSSKGVHFGWGWGADVGRFNSLPDNDFLFARHSFEKDNAVFAMDQFGINHGFLVNGCRTAIDSGASSRGGRVLPLDGAGQYVELHNGIGDFKDSSYALWFKRSGGAADQRLWSFGDGGSKVMYLTPNDAATGGLRFVITNGGTTHSLDGPAIAANIWRHAVVVFSGVTCTLYLDGAAVASNAAMTLFPDALNAPLMENANYLGRGNAANPFQGSLDDFRAYTRPLAGSEVASLFAAAAPAPVVVAADTTAPTPNAAAWLVAPAAVSDSTVTMSATPGSDASGWVEYYFSCLSGGGHDSGWVSFNKYTDVGLTPGATISYTVKMRDRAGNTTAASAAASATLSTSTAGSASFADGPVGIANGQITMTATKVTSVSGKVEYKFDRTSPGGSSSGWQSSPSHTQTGLATGSSHSYTVTVRDGRGNTSAPSAAVSALARDDAAPRMAIPVAHWAMQPYATIDHKVSMTAQAVTDPSGVEYFFHCLSGGGPDSAWQASATFVTPVLPDGTYVYQYKVRDKSPRNTQSDYSTSYPAKITPTTGYHAYTLDQVLTGADDNLVSFPATVMKVNADHYLVKDLATGSSIKVKPNTNALVTDPLLALKNVTVKGHLYTLGGERVVTFSTLAATGNPTLYSISGRVTNSAGTGIAGATVSFADVANASANAIVTATTDASGNYSKGVTTGAWYVAVSSSAHNTSDDQPVAVNASAVSGVNFTLVANASVAGTVTRRSDGTPVAGASVYFSRSAGASGSPVFTAITNASGVYTQPVQDGLWHVAAGGTGFYTAADKAITVNGVAVGGIDFALKGSTRDIPRTADLLFSAVTDSLPGSGASGPWATYQPAGQTLTPMGSPTVENLNGVKWARGSYADGDGFLQGTYAAPVPVNGATIVVAARPLRNTTGTSWTSIVDLFYNRLVLGVRNSTGRIDVCRNGSWSSSATAIPSGQATVLSLVVQPTGQYKVFANGVEVMNVTSASTMTSLVPNVPGGYANAFNVGRNNPDGWTTFNGDIGDVFVYGVALSTVERQRLEADVSAKFLSADPTITASAGAGGTINPTGAVPVAPGGSQTFTILPLAGQVVDQVSVNGVAQGAVSSYTFTNVTANRTIAATFKAGVNAPPTISTVAARQIPANTNTGALAFTVGDATTAAASLTVSASSSNQTLAPDGNIVFGGSGANRTVTVTPVAAMTGSATITLTVGDGSATASSSFLLTVIPPPGAPSITPVAGQSTPEDAATAAIPFTLADSDTAVTALVVTGVSSNPALVPDANIVIGGSGADRAAVITPLPDQSGTTTITLTVSDGSNSSDSAFLLTVNPVNDPPVISAIADQVVPVDGSFGPLAFTVADVDSDLGSLVVSGVSSNQSLMPDANILIGGSGANRTVSATPAAGRSGAAILTLSVSDGSASASEPFALSVKGPSPTISVTFNGNRTLAPTEVAGAEVAVGNWNNLPVGGGAQNGTWAALKDSTAVATSASITTAGWNSIVTMSTDGSPFMKLYEAGIAVEGGVPGGNATVTLQNIPYAEYDVYVYHTHFPIGSDSLQAWTESENGTTAYGTNNRNHGHDWGDYVRYQTADRAAAVAQATSGGDGGGNWLKFTGLTDSNLTLTSSDRNAPQISGFRQRALAAIQIVDVTVAPPPADPFVVWQQDQFGDDWNNPAISAPDLDPDGDGKTNLQEFAFRGDPRDGSDQGLLITRLLDGSDGDSALEFTVTCAVRRGAVFSANAGNAQVSLPVDGVVYTIEGGSTLQGSWNTVVTHQGASDSAPPGSGLPDLAGTGWQYHTFSSFNGLGGRGFLRAGIVKP
jgi:hypothetical protein